MVRIMTYYHSYESCKVCVIACKIEECHIKNTVWIFFFVDATCLNQIEFTMYVITKSSISMRQTSVLVEVVWFVLFLKKKEKEMHY